MFYYQHNIGDFDKATRHLSRLERSIYRDLLDLYYDTEYQLNLDVKYLCRKILALSNEESTAVQQVLNEFFTKTPDGWYHDRCEEEIEKFKNSKTQKSEAGKKSAAARHEKRQRALNGRSTELQQNSNGTPTKQETRNNIQDTSKTNSKKLELDFSAWPQQPSKEVLDAWLAMRKKNKASNTQLAMNTIGNEMHIAVSSGLTVDYCLSIAESSGWKGFKADWITKASSNQRPMQVTNFSSMNYQDGEL
jgi:uncharacterized protein YdaU (DUF1376 family)